MDERGLRRARACDGVLAALRYYGFGRALAPGARALGGLERRAASSAARAAAVRGACARDVDDLGSGAVAGQAERQPTRSPMLSLLSRLASAAALRWAKGSIIYWGAMALEILGAAARIATSRVPRRLLRDGVERSRRFVMLPSFGLSPGLAVVAFVDFGFATRRRWSCLRRIARMVGGQSS